MANLWSLNPKDWFEDEVDPYGTLNPEQRQLVQALGPRLQALSMGPEQYTGQLTEPLSPEEAANVSRFNALAQQGYGTLERLGTYDPTTFNRQFREEVASPAYQTFAQFEQPILEEAVPYSGSARARTVSDALTQLRNQLLTQQFQARETAMDRALTGTTALPGYAQATAGVLGVPRSITQAGLDRQYQEYIRSQSQNRQDINAALNFLGLSTGTYQQDPTMQLMLSALKAGGQMAAAAF